MLLLDQAGMVLLWYQTSTRPGSEIMIFGNKLGCPAAALPCRGSFFSKFWIFPDFWCFFNILKSGDSEPGTPLERSGSKFCAKCRARELRSIYGDPFGEDFVPIGVGQRSGASSFTFSLVPGTRAQVLGPPKANFFEDVPSGITGLEHIRGSPGSRQIRQSGVSRRSSGPPFLTHRGSG